MRTAIAFGVVGLLALIVGCGGSSDSSTDTSATTTGTSSTTTGTSSTSTSSSTTGSGSGGTFSLTADAGSYSGTFSGSRSGTSYSPQTYTGTGTLTLSSAGAANLSYNATTTSGISLTQSFVGTVTSTGAFTGYTQIVPYGGGSVQNITAKGAITQDGTNQVQVVLTWSYPFSNGGIYYTSTETWTVATTTASIKNR